MARSKKSDDAKLIEIARAMMSNPQLTVTEAIKQIGESNAATIRSLRAKYARNAEKLKKQIAEQTRQIDALMPGSDMSGQVADVIELQHYMVEQYIDFVARQQRMTMAMVQDLVRYNPMLTWMNPQSQQAR